MLCHMRTTFRLDDALLKETKQYAARTGRTVTAVVEDALREVLARGRPHRKRGRTRLPTFRGGGVRPGVDLDDTAALLAVMDERRGPS